MLLALLNSMMFIGACAANPGAKGPRVDVPTVELGIDSTLTPRKIPGYTGFIFSVQGRTENGTTTFSYPIITEVAASSPASAAGLRVGDVIVEANGKDARLMGAIFPQLGVRMPIRIRRGEHEIETSLVPVRMK